MDHSRHASSSGGEASSTPPSLLALDNIRLELPIAGLGSRALAVALDYLILGVLQLSVLTGTAVAFALSGGFAEAESAWPIVVLVVVAFVIDWGYFTILEWRLAGRTPGKMAVKLRVVDRQGGRARFSAVVARNLLRTVDILVGAPLIALDEHSRRLGDRFAGTLVLHDTREDTGSILGRVPEAWGRREIEVAEAFLARAPEMDPAQRDYLARRLVRLIESQAPELLVLPHAPDDPTELLELCLQVRKS